MFAYLKKKKTFLKIAVNMGEGAIREKKGF